MKKRGQGWSFDVMIAFFVFITAFFILFFFIINSPQSSQEKILDLKNQADIVANDLLSEGFPENWDSNNVVRIGILTENKINQTKLDLFYNLDYQNTKQLFNIKSDFFLSFSDNALSSFGLAPDNPENLVRLERLTIYENKPITMEIQIWE